MRGDRSRVKWAALVTQAHPSRPNSRQLVSAEQLSQPEPVLPPKEANTPALPSDNVELEELRRLRWAAIANGQIPELLTTEEAAFVYGQHSTSWLLKSNVPRSYPPGRTGKRGEPVWLYSQIRLHAEKHLTHRLDEPVRVRRTSKRH